MATASLVAVRLNLSSTDTIYGFLGHPEPGGARVDTAMTSCCLSPSGNNGPHDTKAFQPLFSTAGT
ncbi:hypothetical protein GCM10008957_52800 [Deinococcus ruber]|uniref:Uncharacterized protein n=1 Tax=Deinococcus ruber TaxID=1848197 RepID=A0A918FGM6_9DEIO|nr:hypothetical protein GCM10008957_52800 [Deinococcus ruber]